MLHLDFHDPISRRFLRSMRRQMFVTTPTSMVNRLTGVETWTDPVNFASGSTVGGQVIGGGSGALVTVPPATTTLTVTAALHGGKTLLLAPTGGLAITPPAATGTGIIYKTFFTAAVTGGSFTWDAKLGNASDVLYGWAQSYKATTFTPYISAGNFNLLTLNGTTTGGAAIGDWYEFQDFATNIWKVTGFSTQSGSIATMFSNH